MIFPVFLWMWIEQRVSFVNRKFCYAPMKSEWIAIPDLYRYPLSVQGANALTARSSWKLREEFAWIIGLVPNLR